MFMFIYLLLKLIFLPLEVLFNDPDWKKLWQSLRGGKRKSIALIMVRSDKMVMTTEISLRQPPNIIQPASSGLFLLPKRIYGIRVVAEMCNASKSKIKGVRNTNSIIAYPVCMGLLIVLRCCRSNYRLSSTVRKWYVLYSVINPLDTT